MQRADTDALVAAILNDCYMVRYYRRGARTIIGKTHRQQAVLKLGLTVRAAFNASEDFEPLLAAIVDGLRPREGEQAF